MIIKREAESESGVDEERRREREQNANTKLCEHGDVLLSSVNGVIHRKRCMNFAKF